MGFVPFDFEGKRYWLSSGNFRSAQFHEKRGNKEMLLDFLQRTATTVTDVEQNEFQHEKAEKFVAEQRPANARKEKEPGEGSNKKQENNLQGIV